MKKICVFLLGAAAILALVAPEKTAEVWQKIKDSVDDLFKKAKESAHDIVKSGKNIVDGSSTGNAG